MAELRELNTYAAKDAARVAWSPDGSRIAIGGSFGLRLLDVPTGTPLWSTSRASQNDLRFSPDGSLLAACDVEGAVIRLTVSAADGAGELWHRDIDHTPRPSGEPADPDNPIGSFLGEIFASGLALALLTPYLAQLGNARFSPDGRWIAYGGLVLDARTGADGPALPADPPNAGTYLPMRPAFSADSSRMAARSAEGVVVLDSRNGVILWLAACPVRPVWSSFTARDEQLLVICEPTYEVLTFDGATGRPLTSTPLAERVYTFLPFLSKPPAHYQLSADGRTVLVSGGGLLNNQVVMLDTTDGSAQFELLTLPCEAVGGRVHRQVELSPAGVVFVVNCPLAVIGASSGKTLWAGAAPAVAADVAYDPTGTRLAILGEGRLRILDTGLRPPALHAGASTRSVSVTGGDRPLAATGGTDQDGRGVASIFDADNGELLVEKPDQGLLGPVLLTPDGSLLATGRTTGVLAVYDTATGARQVALVHDDAVNDLATDRTGTLLASASNDRTARLIDLLSGAERWRSEHPRSVRAVLLDPGGGWLVSACADQLIRVIDATDGAVAASFNSDGQVRTLVGAAAGGVVAASYDGGAVLVIDPVGRRLVGQIDHPRPVEAAALNAPGDLLASGGRDKNLRITAVSADGLQPRHALPTAAEIVRLAFSPTEPVLAVALADGLVLVLDPQSAAEIARLRHPAVVTALTFSADGTRMGVGCDNGDAYVYPTGWT